MKIFDISDLRVVFFDFDGVIKDSVDVKGKCFLEIFGSIDPRVAQTILDHHGKNGGLSRIHKIPLYYSWVHEKMLTDPSVREDLFQFFSDIVAERVAQSPWVPGIELFLRKLKNSGVCLVVVSATPRLELLGILERIGLAETFDLVFGSETDKEGALKISLRQLNMLPSHGLYFGDSAIDAQAAVANEVRFVQVRSRPPNDTERWSDSNYSIWNFDELQSQL